jgi:heat shock protein HslJ
VLVVALVTGLLRVLAALIAGIAVSGCSGSDDEPRQSPAGLWGRGFVSTAVTEGGEPRPLVPDTRITMEFAGRQDHGRLSWRAGCNLFGGELEATPDTLRIEVGPSTMMGCPPRLQEQDEWLARFLESAPGWRLRDDALTLTSGEAAIELEATGAAG